MQQRQPSPPPPPRDFVWINSAIRKDPALKSVSAAAFVLWIELLPVISGDHILPPLETIARAHEFIANEELVLLGELASAGLIEQASHGRLRMSPHSREFYSFTTPEGEDE